MAAELDGIVPRLEDFHVSERLGFILENPLVELPAYFHVWNELANELSDFISHGTLRDRIHEMPLLDHTYLQGHRELRLGHLILSCLASGYVWMGGEPNIPSRLPENLAIPFWGVSERLGLPAAPGMHCSVCLANWKLRDPEGPLQIDNMDTIVKIQGGTHEAWFFLLSVQVELEARPAIVNVVKAQQGVKDRDVVSVIESLNVMTLCLRQMKIVMTRMPERNDPDVFFNVYRLFLAGWDHAAFRRFGYEGLVYEGVSEEPIKVTGGSAAQSAFIYMYDEALGVKHDPEREAIIRRFQEYQCGDHREFVKAVSRGPSIRKFCEVMQNEALSEAYNCCLTALKDFRSYHIQVACRYITIQAHKNAKNNNENYPDQSNAGTGGTGFLPYLKSLRNNTSNSIIEKPDT